MHVEGFEVRAFDGRVKAHVVASVSKCVICRGDVLRIAEPSVASSLIALHEAVGSLEPCSSIFTRAGGSLSIWARGPRSHREE